VLSGASNSYYEVVVEYKAAGAAYGCTLSWSELTVLKQVANRLFSGGMFSFNEHQIRSLSSQGCLIILCCLLSFFPLTISSRFSLDTICSSTSQVFYQTLSSVSDVGVHYTFSIFGRDSWGRAVDQNIIGRPISNLIQLCSPALIQGCLAFTSTQNSTGWADASFILSQSGVYSVSVQALKSRSKCFFFPIHTRVGPCLVASCHDSSAGGINANYMDLQSCSHVPFDLPVDSVHSNDSLSEVFKSIASDTYTKQLGCVLISAVLISPENSLVSIEIETENAAIYSSIHGQPLER